MSADAPAIGFQQYSYDLSAAVARQDGSTVAAILNLGDQLAIRRIYEGLPYSTTRAPQDAPHHQELKQIFRSTQLDVAGQAAWSNIASKHLAAVVHLSRAALQPEGIMSQDGPECNQRAFEAQHDLVKTFVTWMQDSSQGSTTWALPALYVICQDLKHVGIAADDEMRALNRRPSKLEEASRIITKAWTACMNDRSSSLFGGPKRNLATYYLATLLFKIYFKLGTLGLCKNIVRGIQNQSDLPSLSSFPRAHQVTYRYYLGIFAFLNEKYSDAEVEMEFAFANCHRSAYKNQERILSYLIPIKLLRGILPSQRLLTNYPRLHRLYGPLVSAYRSGDLKRYDDVLSASRGALISRGTFLVTERAREGCLRTLFKKVWLCSGSGSRLSVTIVQDALAHVNVSIDSDEVECLLANLIYKGHLKGYISHERQTVVLAKEKPFPDIIGKQLAV